MASKTDETPQGEEVLASQSDHFQRILLTSEIALRNMRTIRDNGN